MLGVRTVPESSKVWLQRGDPDPEGLQTLISVGTGYGRALLVPPGRAHAAEAGYATFAPRNVIERRFCHLKQWRGLATRYDKLAVVYRSAVVLNAVIAWARHLSDMP